MTDQTPIEAAGFELYFRKSPLARKSDALAAWNRLPYEGKEPHYPNKRVWLDKASAAIDAALGKVTDEELFKIAPIFRDGQRAFQFRQALRTALLGGER